MKENPRTIQASPRIGMVSLGCPKALVDSERILTRLRAEGYEFSPDYDGAAAVIVNTCGFLDSAKQESLEAIGEALHENGRVIVTGCLGAEADLIRASHEKVLAITGPQQYEEVVSAVRTAAPVAAEPFVDLVPQPSDPERVGLTPKHYAYLKISEGCNHSCSFCIIPSMRGRLRSRRIDAVLREAEKLVASGVRELLVISQDTSAYGSDLKYETASWRGEDRKTDLATLCDCLGELGVWVRLHYVYPYPSVDRLMPLMAQGRVLPYLDIPFQHSSPSVLRAMKRPANQERTLDRIAAWRAICPQITLRSTFIVGFPGETEADFDHLLNWLEAAQLDRVGCFKYEDVSGAPANDLPGHVAEEVKQERWSRLMEMQQSISVEKLRAKIGSRQTVLIDAVDEDSAHARSTADAPEIDGMVFIDDAQHLEPGTFAEVEITESSEYDLFARLL